MTLIDAVILLLMLSVVVIMYRIMRYLERTEKEDDGRYGNDLSKSLDERCAGVSIHPHIEEEMKALQANSFQKRSSEYDISSLDELFRDYYYNAFANNLLVMPTLHRNEDGYSKEAMRNYVNALKRIERVIRGSGEKVTIENVIKNVNHSTEMCAIFLFLFWAKYNHIIDDGYNVFMREVADKRAHKYYRLYEAKYGRNYD